MEKVKKSFLERDLRFCLNDGFEKIATFNGFSFSISVGDFLLVQEVSEFGVKNFEEAEATVLTTSLGNEVLKNGEKISIGSKNYQIVRLNESPDNLSLILTLRKCN